MKCKSTYFGRNKCYMYINIFILSNVYIFKRDRFFKFRFFLQNHNFLLIMFILERKITRIFFNIDEKFYFSVSKIVFQEV